ncbi:hypothetical protein Q5O24_06895 [Eubacteriaceae bacterium ES3]|nr:hypothetical protein Q5O24_06895 [Eubacteriaceae bacterium ES3]
MLNQLIYTRCMPHRELKNKGQVVRADGFGVFSMSQELVINPPVSNYDFLQTRLAVQNGAKETSVTGLFNSYEYTALSTDIYAMSFEVARPHCKESRKNGQSHRTGTYIKQCLVGMPGDYPFKWFGASAWDAYLKSENDYYLDENPSAEPAWLNTVQEIPNGSYITIERIKQFVNAGRAEAVKAGIWFLVHEYEKPENERKVLLIKDVPENVELWIAAIEYAFSAEMAKKITFATNKTKLGTQNDNSMFFYTDETGKYYPMRNNSMALSRHPYNMIVGYHPKDNFCAAVKQMPTSNFVMIDGTSNTATFATDDSIQSAYYSATVQYEADIIDFTSIVLPSFPVTTITDKIPELYNAYKYLLDSNHRVEKWNYREASAELQVITQYGVPQNDVLNMYILDEGMRGYQRFAAEDERNNFEFLKVLWNIAKLTKRTGEVTGCLADQLSNGLTNLKVSGTALACTWSAIKSGGVQDIVRPALQDLFNDGDLTSYSNQFENITSSTIGTIMEMYYDMLSLERNGIKSILESNEKYRFVCRSLIALIDDRNALRVALDGISGSDDVINAVALSVSQYFEQHMPAKNEMLWDSIIDLSGGNVIELCRTLCRSSETNIDIIEHLLTNAVLKAGKCESELYHAFEDSVKLLGKSKNTGIAFFDACIKVENPSHLDSLIRSIRGNRLFPSAEKELFRRVDAVIPYESTSGMISNTFREMKEWANEIGKTSVGIAFYDLRKNMERERKPEKVVDAMNEFAHLKLALPYGFTSGQYFANLAQTAAEFCDSEVHIAFLSLFDIADSRMKQDYIKCYVDEVLSGAKGKKFVNSMITLCEAFYYEFKIPGMKAAQVKDTANMLKSCFVKALPDYYKSNLAEQVSKANCGEPPVKKMLISLLQDAAKKAPKSGIGDIIGGIFGRRK